MFSLEGFINTRRGSHGLRRAALAAALAAVLPLAAACGGGEPSDSKASVEVETHEKQDEGKYQGAIRPCQALLELGLYEDLVGVDPVLGRDDSRASSGTTEMNCSYDSKSVEDGDPDVDISVTLRVHPGKEPAIQDYEGALELTSNGIEDMNEVDGSWERGARLVAEASNKYLLVIQDENLAVGVSVDVEPFDSLTDDEAMELMTGYVAKTMEVLEG